MLRMAADPETAQTLYDMCVRVAGGCLRDYGPLDLYCRECNLQHYLDDDLIEIEDALALETAQTRAAQYACHFTIPTSAAERSLLEHDPVALVRAAYALVRNLLTEHHILDPPTTDLDPPEHRY